MATVRGRSKQNDAGFRGRQPCSVPAMKLGVIGCGKMATALVEGVIRAGIVAAGDVTGYSPTERSRAAFAKATGANVSEDVAGVVSAGEVILLATKPYQVAAALELAGQASDGSGRLVISVAAGVTLAALEAATPDHFRIVRTMPNTPSLVGKGAAAHCAGSRATAEDSELVGRFLGSVGLAMPFPERLMDAVVGVSGSGPAYVYLIIDALADGGVRAGIPRTDAVKLAAQTVFGAAAMVLETGEHPAVLKDQVTSPGGTTIAALAMLEERGLRSALIEAVGVAVQRSQELGK